MFCTNSYIGWLGACVRVHVCGVNACCVCAVMNETNWKDVGMFDNLMLYICVHQKVFCWLFRELCSELSHILYINMHMISEVIHSLKWIFVGFIYIYIYNTLICILYLKSFIHWNDSLWVCKQKQIFLSVCSQLHGPAQKSSFFVQLCLPQCPQQWCRVHSSARHHALCPLSARCSAFLWCQLHQDGVQERTGRANHLGSACYVSVVKASVCNGNGYVGY